MAKSSKYSDGKYPNSVTRTKSIVVSSRSHNVTMVLDRYYTSCIVVDELHARGSYNTLTYREILCPFLKAATTRDRRPGVLAITGTALTNGVSLALTFAQRVIKKTLVYGSSDAGVQSLQGTRLDPTITEYSRLHDGGQYRHFLRNLLAEAKKNAEAAGYKNVIPTPDHQVPGLDQPAALVYCFAQRSERIKHLLSNVALIHVVLGLKMLIFARNPFEQELVNCLLNVVGVNCNANMSRYDALKKRSLERVPSLPQEKE